MASKRLQKKKAVAASRLETKNSPKSKSRRIINEYIDFVTFELLLSTGLIYFPAGIPAIALANSFLCSRLA